MEAVHEFKSLSCNNKQLPVTGQQIIIEIGSSTEIKVDSNV